MYTTFFKISEFVVNTAYNGRCGLEFIQKNTYDVIILELMLADIDGTKVCKQARAQRNDLPILMLTVSFPFACTISSGTLSFYVTIEIV